MINNLNLEPRIIILGAGIYVAGSDGERMFVTDSGKWIVTTGRAITQDDLLNAYKWGREDSENPHTEEDQDVSSISGN